MIEIPVDGAVTHGMFVLTMKGLKELETMKTFSTDITILLDCSGSMAKVKEDTIGGYNTFIKEQQALGKLDCRFTLIQFDSTNPHDVQMNAKSIKSVTPLTEKTFVPRGNTPLYDAVGMALVSTGERFKKMRTENMPDRIIFVIITDGEENASREYTQKQVFDMIKHQTDVYKWEFVYLGANQDAMAVGADMSIPGINTMSYGTEKIGATYTLLSANIADARLSRATSTLGFTAEQRAKAK